MPDGISITITGLDLVNSTLADLDLGGKLGEQIIRRGLRAGGELMQEAISAAAPVRTEPWSGKQKNPAWNLPPGALKSDITLRVGKNEETGGFSAWVQPGKYTRKVAGWVEYGHRSVRGGRYMNFGKRGKGVQVGETPAHPFIRPAYEATAAASFEAVRESILADVTKAVARLK
jgi:hypothetical protein